MCLLVKSNDKGKAIKYIARKPIRCLKIAVKVTRTTESGETETVYYPPFLYYLDVVYRMGQTVYYNPLGKERLFKAFKFTRAEANCYSFMVDFGIHAWNPKSKSNALKIMYDYVKTFDKDRYEGSNPEVVVLECEIPVGAEYYKGIDYAVNRTVSKKKYGSSYASTNVKVIREVELEK